MRTAPEPWQVGQGSSITVPPPPQREHGWEIENMPWPWVSMPAALAAGAHRRRRAGLGARAAAGRAAWHAWAPAAGPARPRPPGRRRSSTSRLQVGAPFGRAVSCARAARPPRPPNRLDRMSPIEEASKSKLPKPPKPPAGAGPGGERTGAAVVLLALLRVAQHVVGLGDLLEARLCLLVVRVAVGVVLAREFAVGLLDLLGRRFLVDPERLVVVGTRCHAHAPCYAATTTRAGRMMLAPSR